ncbi:MAG: hypothetical protein ACI9RV_002438, partial [Glaciecola sp.]
MVFAGAPTASALVTGNLIPMLLNFFTINNTDTLYPEITANPLPDHKTRRILEDNTALLIKI